MGRSDAMPRGSTSRLRWATEDVRSAHAAERRAGVFKKWLLGNNEIDNGPEPQGSHSSGRSPSLDEIEATLQGNSFQSEQERQSLASLASLLLGRFPDDDIRDNASKAAFAPTGDGDAALGADDDHGDAESAEPAAEPAVVVMAEQDLTRELLSAERTRRVAAEAQVVSLRRQLAAAERSIERVMKQTIDIQERGFQKQRHALQEQLAATEVRRKEAEARVGDQERELRTVRERCAAQEASIEHLEARVAVADSEHATLQARLWACEAKGMTLDRQLAAEVSQRRDAEASLQELRRVSAPRGLEEAVFGGVRGDQHGGDAGEEVGGLLRKECAALREQCAAEERCKRELEFQVTACKHEQLVLQEQLAYAVARSQQAQTATAAAIAAPCPTCSRAESEARQLQHERASDAEMLALAEARCGEAERRLAASAEEVEAERCLAMSVQQAEAATVLTGMELDSLRAKAELLAADEEMQRGWLQESEDRCSILQQQVWVGQTAVAQLGEAVRELTSREELLELQVGGATNMHIEQLRCQLAAAAPRELDAANELVAELGQKLKEAENRCTEQAELFGQEWDELCERLAASDAQHADLVEAMATQQLDRFPSEFEALSQLAEVMEEADEEEEEYPHLSASSIEFDASLAGPTSSPSFGLGAVLSPGDLSSSTMSTDAGVTTTYVLGRSSWGGASLGSAASPSSGSRTVATDWSAVPAVSPQRLLSAPAPATASASSLGAAPSSSSRSSPPARLREAAAEGAPQPQCHPWPGAGPPNRPVVARPGTLVPLATQLARAAGALRSNPVMMGRARSVSPSHPTDPQPSVIVVQPPRVASPPRLGDTQGSSWTPPPMGPARVTPLSPVQQTSRVLQVGHRVTM